MPIIDRRTVLRGAAAAAVLSTPAILRPRAALSQSGEVNVFAWGDYIQDNIREAFEKETGIKLNVSTYGSNEEAENKLRAAGGKGFDLLFPSVDTGPNYYKDDLLQEIDETRLKTERITPAIYRASINLGATHRGKRYLVPFAWGTEAMTWDSEAHPDLGYGTISYGDLWKEGMAGKAAVRQKSVLTSLALYLDATGEVPSNRAMDMYKSPEDARRVFEAVTAYALEHKANVGAFWNNATEATAAFTDAGCSIGQTWDTTGIQLHRETGKKWRYTMPVEGGLAWTDTMAIPAGAANVDQAYELVNFLMRPEIGAMYSNNTGYNSAAVGAAEHLSDDLKAAYEMAYPDEAAIENLWWWPAQTDFFANLRSEYSEKLTNA